MEWVNWMFGSLAVLGVAQATFDSQPWRSILSLWVAGVCVGGIFLNVGAEFLAIVQWIVSTLIAISFVFFSVMFGEYRGAASEGEVKESRRERLIFGLVSGFLGLSFAFVIGLGSSGFSVDSAPGSSQPSLSVLGRKLTQEHLLSLEVLGLALFLILVGSGVIARSEGDEAT